MVWRRVWTVHTRVDGPDGKRSKTATTVAELRALLDAARADPAVWHVRVEEKRELHGDEPTACRNGHGYGGGSATRVKSDWLVCSCGGHFIHCCSWCPDVRVTPEPLYDCDVRIPHDGKVDSGEPG